MNFLKKLFNKKYIKPKLQLHLVSLKNCTKDRKKLYVGQIVAINADINQNDNVIYSVTTFDDCNNITIGKLKKDDEKYGEYYRYATIHDFSSQNINVAIIASNVFLKKFAINVNTNIKNGTLLNIVEQDNKYILMENSIVVGEIIDTRFSKDFFEKIALSQYANNKLDTLIFK